MTAASQFYAWLWRGRRCGFVALYGSYYGEQYKTLLPFFRVCLLGGLGRGHGRGAWPGGMAGGHGRGAWPGGVAGKRGQGAWPRVWVLPHFLRLFLASSTKLCCHFLGGDGGGGGGCV